MYTMPEPINSEPNGFLTKWKTALLHLSIQYKFQNLTNYLITHGCNLNSQDGFGKTPLLKATYQMQSQTVDVLLAGDADMLVSDLNGKNALQTALEFPSISESRPIVKSFTSKIAQICSNNVEDIAKLLSDVKCPLSQVIYFGNADLTRTISSRGYKVNQRNPSDGNTALHVAVLLIDLENVKILLECGADKNATNQEGFMPFFSIFASKKCDDTSAEILRLVMPTNVDWTKCDKDGKLQLYPIFVNSSTEVLGIFLKTYDIDLNATDANGKTVLHYLIERDKTDEYEIFKSTSIDVNVCDSQGKTPLHIAAMRGNAEAVQFLLDKGADTNVFYSGQTPIYLAFGREATIDPQHCIALLLQNATKEQLTSDDKTIYWRIFRRFDDDEEAIDFCKSLTAHLTMLEELGRPTLEFDPMVPIYVSDSETLEPYYRRLWRKRMSIIPLYYWAYKEMLDEMKKIMVHGDVTLFDVLTDDNCGKVISRYAWKSEERVEELKLKFHKEQYAFYYKTRLTMRFDNAKKLARWRCEVAKILSEGMGLFEVDHVVVDKIVRMLEYEDLKRFG